MPASLMFILRMRNTRAWDAALRQHICKQSFSHFQSIIRCGGVPESAQRLALVIKTQPRKTRNSVCSCSDNVITVTSYGVIESAFYACKVKPHPLQERETIPRAATQCIAGDGPTAPWFRHILCMHIQES